MSTNLFDRQKVSHLDRVRCVSQELDLGGDPLQCADRFNERFGHLREKDRAGGVGGEEVGVLVLPVLKWVGMGRAGNRILNGSPF